MNQNKNIDALNNPTPGDFWKERIFCPYFLVVQVKDKNITILSCLNTKDALCAKIDNGDGTWSFDYNKSIVVDKNWLEDKVKYKGIDGFVADVYQTEKTMQIVNEWIDFQTEKLYKQFKELGPRASQYLLGQLQ